MKIAIALSVHVIGVATGWYCDVNHLLNPAEFYSLGAVTGGIATALLTSWMHENL